MNANKLNLICAMIRRREAVAAKAAAVQLPRKIWELETLAPGDTQVGELFSSRERGPDPWDGNAPMRRDGEHAPAPGLGPDRILSKGPVAKYEASLKPARAEVRDDGRRYVDGDRWGRQWDDQLGCWVR